MGRKEPHNGLYLPTEYIIIRMRPLKALISKSTLNRAHAPFSIVGNCPIELKNVKNGNIVKILDDDEYNVYIVQDVNNLPPYIQKELHTNDETVFIMYFDRNNIGYAYWDASTFIPKFPCHRTWKDVKIVQILDANIDMSNLKSKNDFKVLWAHICNEIKK